MTRLSPEHLAALPPDVTGPGYDRRRVGVGIVHLGLGAFHRAHQAVYTDAVLARDGGGPWGICGVCPRRPAVRDALVPQDGLYTVVERDAAGDRLRVVGAVREILVAPEDPAAVVARLADPAVRIVSLTVTEKGYPRTADGGFDEHHPDIAHDLGEPERPRSVVGLLAAGLARRRATGQAPFTVLCCDNLPRNGDTVRRLVVALAAGRDPALARWIRDSVAFPDTMVDRIVPATTDADRAAVAARLGLADAWPVVGEPFRQWVIEDRFPAGRPAWEAAGAELVADVAPYEAMKLRLLNASHSALAWLGCLAGHATIAEAVADPELRQFVAALMEEEVAPTLRQPPGIDLVAYRAAVLQRFANPALGHRTAQVAMDGSQKLPVRVLGTVRDRLAAGAPCDRLALVAAAWMRCIAGTDDRGRAIEISDPLADRLRRAADAAGPDPARLARALLGIAAVFGDDLPRAAPFVAAVTAGLERLFRSGARQAAATGSER